MSKIFSPKFKAEALRLLAAGVPTRAAQAQLKRRFKEHVGEGTLRNWLKISDDKLAAELDAIPVSKPPRPAPPEVLAAPAEDIDTYEHTRQQLQAAVQRATAAAADGNHSAAARFQGDIVKYTLLLARLDKDRKVSTDVVTISRAEFDKAERQALDVLAALRADLERTGGLVCSNCGREIRIALAKGE